jgi:hypothetical protein
VIHYALQCPNNHRFDGWFNSSAGFETQAATGLVACPNCGDTGITRALMSPALANKAARPAAPPSTEPGSAVTPANEPVHPTSQPVALPEGRMPDEMRAALQRMRREIETKFDYVGPGFASEARRIQSGETPPRAIYGEATSDERESLAEEGIAFASLPWVERADS